MTSRHGIERSGIGVHLDAWAGVPTASSLLDDVCEFVRQEHPAFKAERVELPCAEDDVATHRVGAGAHSLRGVVGSRSGVNVDLGEGGNECALHRGAGGCVELGRLSLGFRRVLAALHAKGYPDIRLEPGAVNFVARLLGCQAAVGLFDGGAVVDDAVHLTRDRHRNPILLGEFHDDAGGLDAFGDLIHRLDDLVDRSCQTPTARRRDGCGCAGSCT